MRCCGVHCLNLQSCCTALLFSYFSILSISLGCTPPLPIFGVSPPYFSSEGFKAPFDNMFENFFFLVLVEVLSIFGRCCQTFGRGRNCDMVVTSAAFSGLWYPPPTPYFWGGESIFRGVGLWFDGTTWEFLIFRSVACSGCLEIDTPVWQVGKSGCQGQVISISGSVGACYSHCELSREDPKETRTVCSVLVCLQEQIKG